MREIQLANGKGKVLVDDQDFEELNRYHWFLNINGRPMRRVRKAEKHIFKTVMLLIHRQILGLVDSEIKVDHINRDPLDNQRKNLRLCSNSLNMANCAKHRNNTSGYKGVYWHTYHKKWRARIRKNGKGIELGLFKDVQDAALAYNFAAIKHFGEFARLNSVG